MDVNTAAPAADQTTTQEVLSPAEYARFLCESAEPLGYSMSIESIEEQFVMLNAEQNVRVTVMSRPTEVVNQNLAGSDIYGHSLIFRVRAIRAAHVPALLAAIEEFGDEDGLDLAYLNKFCVSVETIVNVGQNDPDMPMKGDRIVAQVQYQRNSASKGGAIATDRMGNKLLGINQFALPKVTSGSKLSLSGKLVSAPDLTSGSTDAPQGDAPSNDGK